MPTYSRRDFLKTGLAAAGAGVAVAHGFPSIISAQGKEPIKIGVLHYCPARWRSARSRCAMSC